MDDYKKQWRNTHNNLYMKREDKQCEMGWSNQNFCVSNALPICHDVFAVHVFCKQNNPLMERKPKISDTLEIYFYIQTNCCNWNNSKQNILYCPLMTKYLNLRYLSKISKNLFMMFEIFIRFNHLFS